jgi:hypothetical protein
VARRRVISFLRRLRCALSLAVFLEPQKGLMQQDPR